MNQAQLAGAVARRVGSTARAADPYVQAVFDELAAQYAAGKPVEIPGFGKFETVLTRAAERHSGVANAKVSTPAHYTPKFRPSHGLRQRVRRLPIPAPTQDEEES